MTSRSWSEGTGPVDSAPTLKYWFWLGTSDKTAFVERAFLEPEAEGILLQNPCLTCCEFALKLLGRDDLRSWRGISEVGLRKNCAGLNVGDETTMDRPIFGDIEDSPSLLWFCFLFLSALCVVADKVASNFLTQEQNWKETKSWALILAILCVIWRDCREENRRGLKIQAIGPVSPVDHLSLYGPINKYCSVDRKPNGPTSSFSYGPQFALREDNNTIRAIKIGP